MLLASGLIGRRPPGSGGSPSCMSIPRRLIGRNREAFWKSLVITQQQSTPTQLWQSIDRLFGRGRLRDSDDIIAGISTVFLSTRKIRDVYALTSGIATPSFASIPTALSPSRKMMCVMVHQCVRGSAPTYLKQESLANAKVNARQHCVSLPCLGDEDSENIASERYVN